MSDLSGTAAVPLISARLTLPWLASHATGKDVEVAVLDTGIDGSHPALKGRISRGCVVKRDSKGRIHFREISRKACTDDFGHGTAVAGIIAGLAPGARIVNVKVLDDHNSTTGDVLIAGLRWAIDQNIRLLNLSLATSRRHWIPALFSLCERAFIQNSIIVSARRNIGDVGYPAMFSSVISVDRADYREELRIHYRPNDVVQFDARGTAVKVAIPGGGYSIQTGTSFATPHVCAIVALLLELFPALTAVEARAVLKAFSDRLHRGSR